MSPHSSKLCLRQLISVQGFSAVILITPKITNNSDTIPLSFLYHRRLHPHWNSFQLLVDECSLFWRVIEGFRFEIHFIFEWLGIRLYLKCNVGGVSKFKRYFKPSGVGQIEYNSKEMWVSHCLIRNWVRISLIGQFFDNIGHDLFKWRIYQCYSSYRLNWALLNPFNSLYI